MKFLSRFNSSSTSLSKRKMSVEVTVTSDDSSAEHSDAGQVDSAPSSPPHKPIALPQQRSPIPLAAQSVPNLATTSAALTEDIPPLPTAKAKLLKPKPTRRTTLLRPNTLAPVHENITPPSFADTPTSSVFDKQKKPKRGARIPLKVPKALKIQDNDKKAKDSAEAIRTLILGETSPVYSTASVNASKAKARPSVDKVRGQLMQPKSANRVIAQLRTLSVQQDNRSVAQRMPAFTGGTRPIKAVCLSHTEAEEDDLHFKHLCNHRDNETEASSFFDELPSILNASADKITDVLGDMQLIDLLTAPGMGLGQPAGSPGILAGAVPTAETVIQGAKIVTPALMELGYATGQAFLPDHSGIYPPTDRISVLTYWWGLEVVLPPPTLDYIVRGKSISTQVVNFLSALAMVNNGVRELLPFVRYISQFIEFEINTIIKQNKGKGVVCAATWIMPAAMVPRPWDFDPPPPEQTVDPSAQKRLLVPDEPTPVEEEEPPVSVEPVAAPAEPSLPIPSESRKSNLISPTTPSLLAIAAAA